MTVPQSPYRPLAGRVALVTGASRGIGAAVARAFAAAGGAVALAHEPAPEMAALAQDLAGELERQGGRAVALGADLADPAAVERLVATAREQLGPLDVLVANAAALPRAPWHEITVDQWDHVQHVNLRGTWLLVRAAYPDLRASAHASVITVTSVMVETGQPGALHYTASKAGIIGLTRALARELGEDGIRVNAVMPGAIRTEHEIELAADADAAFARITAKQALKRRGFADDMVGAFVFLASDEAGFITGQVVNVDGGWVLR
jgi:3-oxoacyl-[acyl-carrier protein] reductase